MSTDRGARSVGCGQRRTQAARGSSGVWRWGVKIEAGAPAAEWMAAEGDGAEGARSWEMRLVSGALGSEGDEGTQCVASTLGGAVGAGGV